ncbi:MAG TPA: hypothetical protein VGM30_05450 [Puia sp.]|jgi:hypothetical protein
MQLEKIINTAYSFGAAVVVFGAWAKIEHKEYSDDALTVGLLVEAGIFCIYGLLEWIGRQPGREKSVEVAGGMPPGVESPAGKDTNRIGLGELTETMQQTNKILSRVFRAGE